MGGLSLNFGCVCQTVNPSRTTFIPTDPKPVRVMYTVRGSSHALATFLGALCHRTINNRNGAATHRTRSSETRPFFGCNETGHTQGIQIKYIHIYMMPDVVSDLAFRNEFCSTNVNYTKVMVSRRRSNDFDIPTAKERRNSSALVMELCLFSTNPAIC